MRAILFDTVLTVRSEVKKAMSETYSRLG